MNKTGIEWCDYTWNPVTGCSSISEGCHNCYARRMAQRLRGRCGYPADDPFCPTFHPERLDEPYSVRKSSKIFVCSMGDLFHDDVSFLAVATVLRVAQDCPRHTFILLTKRPERMRQFFDEWVDDGLSLFPWLNLWLGVSVENQHTADERIPVLRQIPAAVRWLSVEPMLTPIDLCLSPGMEISVDCAHRGIHLVVCGPETGPGKRPFDPAWAENLWRQCRDASVPFFWKGEIAGEHWQVREFPGGVE